MATIRRPFRRWALRLLLLVVSLAFALLLVEGALHVLWPLDDVIPGQDDDWRNLEKGVKKAFVAVFVADDELGYRPVLESASEEWFPYGDHGTLKNPYPLEKRPGVQRLLFIGDSVVFRGKFVAAVRELLGDDKHEYWNAGVEGYSTLQEVAYYRRFNRAIKPDRVVLVFHNNDFRVTPALFPDKDGNLTFIYPDRPVKNLNPWLFANSQIYRRIVNMRISQMPKYTFEENVRDARDALEELAELCKADGIPLDVVLLPMFLPYTQWGEEYQRSRNESLKIFGGLGIDHVDLYGAMGRAFDAGVAVQESPADRLHPSLKGCRFMLQDVKSRGGWKLLDG